jgi:hypothetical protein
VTPKQSKFRHGNSQFYGSVKEITDAAKCKPFDSDGLEEFALDPQIRQGARQLEEDTGGILRCWNEHNVPVNGVPGMPYRTR